MPILDHVRTGAKWGLAMGTILSAWALLLALIQRSASFHYSSGESISVLAVVPIYIGTGLFAGALFGAMIKFVSSRIVAALLGMIVTAPFEAAVLMTRTDYAGWSRVETLAVIIMPVVFGIPAGLILRGFTLKPKS